MPIWMSLAVRPMPRRLSEEFNKVILAEASAN